MSRSFVSWTIHHLGLETNVSHVSMWPRVNCFCDFCDQLPDVMSKTCPTCAHIRISSSASLECEIKFSKVFFSLNVHFIFWGGKYTILQWTFLGLAQHSREATRECLHLEGYPIPIFPYPVRYSSLGEYNLRQTEHSRLPPQLNLWESLIANTTRQREVYPWRKEEQE